MTEQMKEALIDQLKYFTCKRTRMAAYLVERGFKIDSIKPESDDSDFNVYQFLASPELYEAVLDYTSGKASERNEQ